MTVALVVAVAAVAAVAAQEKRAEEERSPEAQEALAAATLVLEAADQRLLAGTAVDRRAVAADLETVLEVFRRAQVADAEAETLYTLALARSGLGELDAALESYRQALLIYRRLVDLRSEAAVLNNMGLIYAEQGLPGDAFAALESALPLRLATADREGEAATVHNLGALHVQVGELQAGLDLYRRALGLHRELGNPATVASTLNNLGLVRVQVGEPKQALGLYREALALHRVAGNRQGEAGTLGNIGLANFELDRYALALGHLEASLVLHRDLDDRAGEGDVLNNLGLVYLEAGQLEAARPALEKALAIHRSLGDRRGEAADLSNLGQLLASSGKAGPGRELLLRALALQGQVDDLWGSSFTMLELARVDQAAGDFEGALVTITRAIEILESLRADIQSPGARASLVGSRRELYDLRVDVLMRLHARHPRAGHDAAALATAERARGRVLLESLGEARVQIRRGADPEILAVEQELRRRLSGLSQRHRRALREGSGEDAAELESRIEVLLDDAHRIENQLREASPRWAEWIRPEPLTTAAIREQLDTGTVLLFYNLGEERSTLWAVTREAVNAWTLAPRQRIEEAARRLHGLLQRTRERAFRGPAEVAAGELSDLILRPALELLADSRVVVVADGALGGVPFAILTGVSGQPLVSQREIVALPSASVLGRLGVREQPESIKTLAIVADPVFAANDPRLGVNPPPSREVEPLPRLVHSRREAERLAAMVPAAERLVALGFEANRELVTGGALGSFKLIHFATHGVLDARRPELSALVLSRFDAQGRPQDGHLRLLDVYNLELRAELVVLSACRTALGREIRGEGLVGLARGFFYAGARQVLVSLWNVDDEATALLMERFYRGLLIEGMPAAAALRAAQLSLRAEARWSAPFYWAGFVLQGDWRVASAPD